MAYLYSVLTRLQAGASLTAPACPGGQEGSERAMRPGEATQQSGRGRGRSLGQTAAWDLPDLWLTAASQLWWGMESRQSLNGLKSVYWGWF